MVDSDAPANVDGGAPGTTSGLSSAPSDLSIADMEQRIERIRAEFSIWHDAHTYQCSMLRKAQLKAVEEEENAATATARAMEALQQQEDILDSARTKVKVLDTFYSKAMVQMQDLVHEKAKEGAAEIQAIRARIDEKRKQMAGYDASSAGKGA